MEFMADMGGFIVAVVLAVLAVVGAYRVSIKDKEKIDDLERENALLIQDRDGHIRENANLLIKLINKRRESTRWESMYKDMSTSANMLIDKCREREDEKEALEESYSHSVKANKDLSVKLEARIEENNRLRQTNLDNARQIEALDARIEGLVARMKSMHVAPRVSVQLEKASEE